METPPNVAASVKKWDVAISFLSRDLGLAEALHAKLSEGLKVFFAPRKQEVVAGTMGDEVFRQTFLKESRLNVVVYRNEWGRDGWTNVEALAIRDSCVKNQFRNLFLYTIGNDLVFPEWLPQSFMRFNSEEYTLEQAVGAIKLRVAEQGGQYEPMTPIKKAKLMKAEQEFQIELSNLSSIDVLPQISSALERLLESVSRFFSEID